jgi:hypothetical protein
MQLVEKQTAGRKVVLIGKTLRVKMLKMLCTPLRLKRMYWQEVRRRTFIRGVALDRHFNQLENFINQYSVQYYGQLYYRCQKVYPFGFRKIYWRLVKSNYNQEYVSIEQERYADTRPKLDQTQWKSARKVRMVTDKYNTSRYGIYTIMFVLVSKEYFSESNIEQHQIEEQLRELLTRA